MLFALPTFTSRQLPGAISFIAQARRVPCIARPGHHGPDHSRDLVGKRDSRNLGRPPRQQGREPGPMFGAMDLGVADDRKRAGHEQAAQIAVTLLAYIAEPVLASTRVLLRHNTDPGREVAP